MYLAVKKGNLFLFIFYFSKHYSLNISLIYPAVYLLNNMYLSCTIVDTAPELCQKVIMFSEKEDERHLCSGMHANCKIHMSVL